MNLDYVLREMLREVVRDELQIAMNDLKTELSRLQPPPPQSDRYLSVAQAAELAAVTPETIREWVRKGDLRAGKAGRLVRIRSSDLQAYFERAAEPRDEVTDKDIERMAAEILASAASRCAGCGHVKKMHVNDRRCRAKKCSCPTWVSRDE